MAAEHGITSIAFPCISTGAYGFPPELAAPIAISTVRSLTGAAGAASHEIVFCSYSSEDHELYCKLLGQSAQS